VSFGSRENCFGVTSMKCDSMAVLLAISSLAIVSAQSLPPTTFHVVTEGAAGDMYNSSATQYYSVSFTETAQKGKNKLEGGALFFTVCAFLPPGSTGVSARTCYNGSGSVPGDAVSKLSQAKSPSASISIKIADLTAVPGFSLWGETCDENFSCQPIFAFPQPFSFLATLRATNLTTVDSDVSETVEQRLPDGTILKQTFRGKRTWTTAIGTGMVANIVLDPSLFAQIFDQRSATRTWTFSKPPRAK
jgi:hypothetical protein